MNMRIFNFLKKKKINFLLQQPVTNKLDFTQIYQAYQSLHHIRAIHTLLAGGANRLEYKVFDGDIEARALTAVFNSYAGLLFADWFTLGRAVIDESFVRLQPDDDEGIVIINPNTPLEAAASLIFKLYELERAQKQAFYLAGAQIFAVPANTQLIATPHEIEQTRKILQSNIRQAGVGGIEILPTTIEFKQINNKLSDFNFEKLTTQLLRELCNLFAIDSSLLNDPENKTYSNKEQAQKAFFTNLIIPQVSLFLQQLTRVVWQNININIRIDFSAATVEAISEQRLANTQQVIELVKSGIISIDEARKMLEL